MFKKRLLIWLVVLPLCLALPFIVWRVHFVYNMNARLAPFRAAGLPTSAAELNQWYTAVPDSENAATTLGEAFKLLRDFPDAHSNWDANPSLDRRERWSNETRKTVVKYLAINAEAMAKAQEGVRHPRCRYPVDFTTEAGGLFLHLSQLKSLALKARLRSSLAAEEGRAKDSVADINLMLELAHTLDREPGIVSQQVRIAIVMLAAQAAERMLNLTGLDEATDEILARSFAHTSSTNSIQTALVGELGLAIPFFQKYWLVVGTRDMNFYCLAMETNLALANLGPPASLKLQMLGEKFYEMIGKKDYPLAGTFLYSAGRMAMKDASTHAHSRLAQTALALERFRLARGQLPEKLDDLIPQFLPVMPADPFDGAPLRYRQLKKGYLIYSVGEDGHDDGGRERPKLDTQDFPGTFTPPVVPVVAPVGEPTSGQTINTTSYDLTFTVER